MKKKLFAGLLAALMLLPMLSACGSNNASEKGSEGKKQEATYVWKCALNSTEGDKDFIQSSCCSFCFLWSRDLQLPAGHIFAIII